MIVSDLKLAACVALVVLAICVSTFGGFMAGRASMDCGEPESIEPAPEQRLEGGALMLGRDPEPASEPAPHTIPPGHVEERRISVQVQPDVSTNRPNLDAAPACECKPVRVDLSLVRDTAGGRRVITSTPDGQVLGGMDVPIIAGSLFVNREWAAGISYEPFRELYGVWADRNVGRIRLGAEIQQYEFREERGLEVWAKVGWTF